MARKSKNLSTAFERFSNNKTKQGTETEKQLHETEVDNVIQLSNKTTVAKDVTLNSNTATVTNDETVSRNTVISSNPTSNTTVGEIKKDLLSMYEEKKKKETVEDTHTRTTFLFRKDLAKRLDRLSKNKRGFKTMFMNKAIEALLDEMEEK